MTARHVLYGMLLMTALWGMAESTRSVFMAFLLGWLLHYLCFLWYCRDSDARGYRRSRWLSICMVGIQVAAVPYYLARSRQSGQKAWAIMRLLGFVLVLGIVTVIGMVCGAVL